MSENYLMYLDIWTYKNLTILCIDREMAGFGFYVFPSPGLLSVGFAEKTVHKFWPKN